LLRRRRWRNNISGRRRYYRQPPSCCFSQARSPRHLPARRQGRSPTVAAGVTSARLLWLPPRRQRSRRSSPTPTSRCDAAASTAVTTTSNRGWRRTPIMATSSSTWCRAALLISTRMRIRAWTRAEKLPVWGGAASEDPGASLLKTPIKVEPSLCGSVGSARPARAVPSTMKCPTVPLRATTTAVMENQERAPSQARPNLPTPTSPTNRHRLTQCPHRRLSSPKKRV
jgi:hypothetical protein